jgi:hypothetical protein
MLHAPATETKHRKSESKANQEPHLEHQLHPRLGVTATQGWSLGAGSESAPTPASARGPDHWAELHGTYGNQAVLRALQSGLTPGVVGGLSQRQPLVRNQGVSPRLQTKLTINTPGDQYEQEADRVADQVMRMPDDPSQALTAPVLRRKCACGGSGGGSGTCSECAKKEELQRSTAGPAAVPEAPPIVHDVLGQLGRPLDASLRTFFEPRFGHDVGKVPERIDYPQAPPMVHDVLRSPGRPLDPETRSFMEPRFGYDLSHVRVHEGTQAGESTRAVNALAYTVGSHIVIGDRNPSPHTAPGRRLLAHELTHVLQQRAANYSWGILQRETISDCDTEQARLVSSAVAIARRNLAHVDYELHGPLSADIQNALWIYFRDTSPTGAAKVSSNLSKLWSNLGGLSFECEDDCSTDLVGYTPLGTILTGLGNIHLCMNNLEGKVDKIADTMIHEAAHYFLLASDSYDYYDRECAETDETVQASPGGKFTLADSYNCLVRNWIEGSASARATARTDLSGASLDLINQSPPGPIDLNGPRKHPTFEIRKTDGTVATITGVSYFWSLRDSDRPYTMTNTAGEEVHEFRPASESAVVFINTHTRNLLRERGVSSGWVRCQAKSPVFGDKEFIKPVFFI